MSTRTAACWRTGSRAELSRCSAMTTQVLIYDVQGPQYRALLAKRFPTVAIPHRPPRRGRRRRHRRASTSIMGLGHHIPPALIAKAKNLKWVQALTTGTETLTAPGVLPPHVLLTSTRGIHGPQMSELAFLNMIALRAELQKEPAQPGRGQMGAVGPADPRRQDHRHRRPGPAGRASRRALQAVRHDGDRREQRPRQRAAFRRGASAERAREARRARRLPDAAGALLAGNASPDRPRRASRR